MMNQAYVKLHAFGRDPIFTRRDKKISVVIFIIVMGTLPFLKNRKEPDIWLKFGEDVITAGRSGDPNQLLQKLTLYRTRDAMKFVSIVRENRPDLVKTEDEIKISEDENMDIMLRDCEVFMRSYEDLFEGEPVMLCRATDPVFSNTEVCGMVLWVKKGEKFHGILIHRIWLDGKTPRVLAWVEPEPIFEELYRKRVILDANSLDECVVPKWFDFEQEGTLRYMPSMNPVVSE